MISKTLLPKTSAAARGIGFGKPELEGQCWTKFGTFNIVLGVEPE